MADLTASNILTPESSNCSEIISPSANMSTLQNRMLSGPVSILWDIENCPVPRDVNPEDVAGNIRMALRMHPLITGAVTHFSAFGDFNGFRRQLREGCQRTGVKLVDVPNGRKDAADKAILVDMFLFAFDNPPPSSILLISGDVDFASALHILGQRGYTVILVIPARVDVSSALTNAGRFVWDWPSLARGEGFMPPKFLIPRVPNLACYFSSSQIGDNTEGQYEESIVYTGISRREYSARGNLNQMHFNSMSVVKEPSRGLLPTPGSGTHPTIVPCAPSKAQSLPYGVVVDGTQVQDQSSWVHPGDIQGLRGQLIKLLEMFGGSLALARVPPEYLRKYGRRLCVAEYGVFKLVNLINKIGSPLSVVDVGQSKMVCLQNVADKKWWKKSTLTYIFNHGGQVHDTMEIFGSNDSKGQLATSNKDEENGEKRVVDAFPSPRYLQYAGVMLLGALGGFALGFCLRSSKKEAPSKGSWRNIHEVLVGVYERK